MLYRGSTRIGKVFRGSTQIGKIYRGSQLVYTVDSGVFVPNLKNLIGLAGLSTGLDLCLDAGDINSFDPDAGDPQLWKDTSGNGFDYYRGASGSGETSDPTFNGTPGALTENEYFSSDGGDYFTLAQSTPAKYQGYHQNMEFTVMGVFRVPSTSAFLNLFSTAQWSAGAVGFINSFRGMYFGHGLYNQGDALSFTMAALAGGATSGAGVSRFLRWYSAGVSRTTSPDFSSPALVAAPTNALAYALISFKKASHAFVRINTVNYSAPSNQVATAGQTGNILYQPKLFGNWTNTASLVMRGATSGCRIYAVAVWDRGISADEANTLYTTLRTNRFTSLPV